MGYPEHKHCTRETTYVVESGKFDTDCVLHLPAGDSDGGGGGGYGEDIAVLDTGYFLSQILLSVVMGKLVEITAAPQLYFLAASACGFLSAAAAALFVAFGPEDMLPPKATKAKEGLEKFPSDDDDDCV